MKRSVITISTAALLFSATPAVAGLTWSLDLATNFSQLQDNSAGAPDHAAELGFGGGTELGFTFDGGWGLDFGVLYLQRRYGTSYSGVDTGTTTTETGFEFPVILRYWVGDVVSFGLGPYYFKAVDQPAQQTDSDYGAVASLRFDFPLSIMTGVVLDGRYAYGLANNSATGGDLKYRDLTAIIGLRFGWMK